MADLDLVLGALADRTRRGMCERLLQGEQTISEVAEPYLKEMSFPAITKHLNVLEKSGLIRRKKSGRTCLISLQTMALQDLVDYLDDYQTRKMTAFESEVVSPGKDFEIGVND